MILFAHFLYFSFVGTQAMNLEELLAAGPEKEEKVRGLQREPSTSRDRHVSLASVAETLSPRKSSSANATNTSSATSSLLSRLPANVQMFQQDIALLSNEEIFARFSLLTKMIYFLGMLPFVVFIYLFIYLFTYLLIYLFIYLFNFIYLFIYLLFIYLFICLFNLSLFLSLSRPFHFCSFVFRHV
jgi:hypothetical protein